MTILNKKMKQQKQFQSWREMWLCIKCFMSKLNNLSYNESPINKSLICKMNVFLKHVMLQLIENYD